MTKPDRLGSLLTAIALMEAEPQADRDQRINTLLPQGDPREMITLLASMSWCASFLAGQLAGHLGVDYTTVTESLRGEALERFQNNEGENQ